jgi:GGDEF domain-containing protein
MAWTALPEGTPRRSLEPDPGALAVLHGRAVGCKFELRRRQVTIGGGAGDDVRLDGLAPCVVRLDRTPAGWNVTRLADTLDVAIDGRATSRAPLPVGAELWIDTAILELVPSSPEAYEDLLLRISTRDAVTGLANDRWWHELIGHDRARSEVAGVPLSLATFRLLGLAELAQRHGAVAVHRLLRAVAVRLRTTLGDRPLGRVRGSCFTALLEGNLDARYPFVDALRRDIAEIAVETDSGLARVRAVAALADVTASTPLEPLETRIADRLESAVSGLLVVD